MFNRIQIKNRAKQTLATTYWQSLGITAIISLISGIAGNFFSLRLTTKLFVFYTPVQAGIVGLITLLQIGLFMAISIFLITPLSLGLNKFMLDAARSGRTDIGAIGYSFRSDYKNIVKVTFMKELILTLFVIVPLVLALAALVVLDINPIVLTMPRQFADTAANLSTAQLVKALGLSVAAYVLMIPFLIKTLDYYMVEYILSDNSSIDFRDALRKSKQMMRANRWATFVMQLSFLGWALLGVLLCGFGTILVEPYINSANAHLYLELSGQNTVKTDGENSDAI